MDKRWPLGLATRNRQDFWRWWTRFFHGVLFIFQQLFAKISVH
jgi:hypothetical protein